MVAKKKKQAIETRAKVKDLDVPLSVNISSLTQGFLVASIAFESIKLKLMSIQLTLDALADARTRLQQQRDEAKNNPDLAEEAKQALVNSCENAIRRLRDFMVSINLEIDPLLDQLENPRQQSFLRAFWSGVRNRLGLPQLF